MALSAVWVSRGDTEVTTIRMLSTLPRPDGGGARVPPNVDTLLAQVVSHCARAVGAFRSVQATARHSLLKIKHTPEQLFDVTLFPARIILMLTYMFGRALAGSTGALTCST